MTDEEWFDDMEDGLRESLQEVYGEVDEDLVAATMEGVRKAAG